MRRKPIQLSAIISISLVLGAGLYHLTGLLFTPQHSSVNKAQTSIAQPIGATTSNDQQASDVAQAVIASEKDELNKEVLPNSSLLPLDALTDAVALQTTLRAIQTTKFVELVAYLEGFRVVVNPRYDSSSNHYLPAVYKAVIQQLAGLNFDATLEYVLTDLREKPFANGFWHQLALNTLAEQEPEYVARGLTSSAGAFADAATLTTFNDIAINLNPAITAESALAALTQGQGDVASNEELLTDALNKWMLTDPHTALDFVQTQILDAKDLATRTSDMLHFWLEANPEAARSEVQQRLDTGLANQPEAYLDLAELHVEQWSQSDPAAAYEWLREKDNELLYQQSMKTLLQNWLDSENVYEVAQLIQIDSRQVTDALSLNDQFDLTEKLILALVETGNQQQANEWLKSQANREVIEHGTAILRQIANN